MHSLSRIPPLVVGELVGTTRKSGMIVHDLDDDQTRDALAARGEESLDVILSDFPFEKYELGHLTAQERGAMSKTMHRELAERVGRALSEGLADAELAEFEAFMDRAPGFGLAWLQAHAPIFRTEAPWSETWQRVEASSPTDEVAYAEMASLVWLQTKRPNHRQTVERIRGEILREIDEFLNATQEFESV